MRLYEAHGASGNAVLKSMLPFTQARQVNLLEEPGETLSLQREPDGVNIPIAFRGFEIISVELSAT